ncbi:MAG: TIGR04282 family arsenosugar biosynthesis glycosyltransferase [Chloroflexota bacterium]|nr:TIGR04282 family arsenosugar biosynthesis glycosyltransferase [Chloroflexota bacterium]
MKNAGSRALMIMAKAPFPGEAKTRLAANLGPDAAAHLHRAFLLDTLARVQTLAIDLVGVVCPDHRHRRALVDILPPRVEVLAQTRPGLMAGITEAVGAGLSSGTGTVVVIEADSPNLPGPYIEAAFQAAEQLTRGIVLGPCDDGGYYLVAARGIEPRHARDLFEGERYESHTICERTAGRARTLGLEVAITSPWYDVDTLHDLHRLHAQLGEDPASLPHVREALNRVQLPPPAADCVAG